MNLEKHINKFVEVTHFDIKVRGILIEVKDSIMMIQMIEFPGHFYIDTKYIQTIQIFS